MMTAPQALKIVYNQLIECFILLRLKRAPMYTWHWFGDWCLIKAHVVLISRAAFAKIRTAAVSVFYLEFLKN
jgi:hypothetical protein